MVKHHTLVIKEQVTNSCRATPGNKGNNTCLLLNICTGLDYTGLMPSATGGAVLYPVTISRRSIEISGLYK